MEERNAKREVAGWKTRIDRAIKKRKEYESEWEKNYKAIYGDDYEIKGKRAGGDGTNTSTGNNRKRYSFDLCLAYLRTELPSLVLFRPEVFLSARELGEQKNPEKQQLAKLVEAHVNTTLADMDGIETEIRCMLADAHAAYGIQKTYPIYEIQPHPKAGQPGLNPETEEPVLDEAGQPVTYPDEQLIQSPKYEICRVDPFKFLIDETTKNNPNKAPWKGEEIDKTLEEVKLSGMYENALIDKLEAKIREKQGQEKEDWEISLKLYEIYDRFRKKIIVICDEYPDDFLRYDDIPEGIESDPYTILKFCEIPGQWFPKPEMTSGRVLQDDYREGREWQRSQARKSNPQTGVKPAVKEPERTKIGDGISEVIELNSEADVFPVNKESMHKSEAINFHMDMCMKDFDQTMGQSSQDRGLTGEAKFATEAEIAEMKGNVRGNDKLQIVKSFEARGIEKLLFLMQYNPTEDEEIRATLAELRPDLDVEIDVESKSPKNRAIERKQLLESANTFAPLASSPTFIDQLLRTFGMREREKILEEIQAIQQASAQSAGPQKPGIALSLALKQELLPEEAVDRIVDMLMNADIPISGGNGDNGKPAMAQAPAEGTEGMEPGSGMMPGGEVI